MKQAIDTPHQSPKKRTTFAPGAVLLIVALIVAACSSDNSTSDGASTTDTPVSTSSETPQASNAAVPDQSETPTVDLATVCPDMLPDIEMTCGELTVPVDHDEPDGDMFSLPYVVLPALGDNPAAEPLVYLEGGPGLSTLEALRWFVDDPDLRHDRDMIFLEQRGTDPSGVFLRCDPDLADLADVQQCYDGYVADGIDLSAFTTLNAAKDLALLRGHLDIERWHLMGASYGTTLAMVAMDNDPDGTASVILDGPTAPDVIIYNADVESLLDGFSKVFANCEADDDCSSRHKALFDTHIANFEGLFEAPWNVDDPELIDFMGPTIDHQTYQTLSLMLVMSEPGSLPAFVTAISNRDGVALLELIKSTEDADVDEGSVENEASIYSAGIAQAMNFSVYCAEEAPFFNLDTNPIETVDEWPEGTIDLYIVRGDLICDVWKVDPADPGDADQIRSAIPTLVLAGEYDYTTPIRQAEIAAAGLSQAEVIEVPSTGHTTWDNQCARTIMADFLRAPGGDRSCLADIPPIEWR